MHPYGPSTSASSAHGRPDADCSVRSASAARRCVKEEAAEAEAALMCRLSEGRELAEHEK
jgi:hypothetical protein